MRSQTLRYEPPKSNDNLLEDALEYFLYNFNTMRIFLDTITQAKSNQGKNVSEAIRNSLKNKQEIGNSDDQDDQNDLTGVIEHLVCEKIFIQRLRSFAESGTLENDADFIDSKQKAGMSTTKFLRVIREHAKAHPYGFVAKIWELTHDNMNGSQLELELDGKLAAIEQKAASDWSRKRAVIDQEFPGDIVPARQLAQNQSVDDSCMYKIFAAIYRVLHKAEGRFSTVDCSRVRTSFLTQLDKQKIDDDSKLVEVIQHAKKNPESRTAKAWQMTKDYFLMPGYGIGSKRQQNFAESNMIQDVMKWAKLKSPITTRWHNFFNREEAEKKKTATETETIGINLAKVADLYAKNTRLGISGVEQSSPR